MQYLIGDFSTISRLGIKTLRYYHEIGLLKPVRVDTFTGYRYYDESSLARVRAIQRLKGLNFSLGEIQEILDRQSVDETLLESIQKKLAEMDERITEMWHVRERLAAFVTTETLPVIFADPVLDKEIPEMQIASIRFTGQYSELTEKITRLYKTCGQAAVGAPFSLYYDDHPLEEGSDIEICVPVNRIVENENVHTRQLCGGHALSILHHGGYDQIWVSYQAVVDMLNQRDLKAIYPSREIYLRGGDPTQSGEIQNFLTEIQFLVENI